MITISKILLFALIASLNIASLAIAGEEYAYSVSTDRSSVNVSSYGVTIIDGEVLDRPGAPSIEYRIVKLALPPNTRIESISTDTSVSEILWNGEIDFIRGDSKTAYYSQDSVSFPDSSIYGSDNIFPESRVQILSSGNWGAVHLVDLAVYAVAYKPLSGIVLFYPEITVHFTLEPDLDNNGLRIRNDRYAYNALSNLVGNKVDFPRLASPGGGEFALPFGSVPPPEYLIITSGEIAPGFYPFLNWKNQKGMPADIILIEDILSSSPGIDPAEQLRNFLIQSYNNGVRYVLLGGDEDVVPIRYLYPNNVNGYIPELHHQQISDLYYADLTGNWDVDGDGVWGESYNDQPDIYPELYVGRVPARAAEQAAVWGSKAITYEKNPGNGDPSYLAKALFICSDQMRDLNQHQVLASMIPSNFTVDNSRLAEEPSGSDPNPTQPLAATVIDVMQEGWGFISNLNHGDFSWYASQASGYNTSNRSGVWGDTVLWDGCGALSDLTTYNQPAVHYTISCDLAAFDFDKGVFFPGPYISPYCFMESYMFEPGAGVAFLGNTRWGWVSSSYNLEKKFVSRVFNDSTNILSVAEALSKIDYPNHRDLAYGHNLFGDPEMSLWISVDGFLQISGPADVEGGTSQSLTYTAKFSDQPSDPDGLPAQGVRVCLYKAGDIFDVAYTDDQGQAYFIVRPESDGYITVTATKSNLVSAQQIVVVGSPLDVGDDAYLPDCPTIYQNFPNPFNLSTSIEFDLPVQAQVELKIYDIRGRLVRTLVSETCPPGKHTLGWDGENDIHKSVASGVYFYKFDSGTTSTVRQMTILK